MDKMEGAQLIKKLQRKWIFVAVVANIMVSASISFVLSALLHVIISGDYWWSLVFFPLLFALLSFVQSGWRVKETGIAQLLDQRYPVMQESTGLLLLPFSSLNSLETLQYKKVNEALLAIPSPLGIVKRLLKPFLIIVVSLLAAAALQFLPLRHTANVARVKPPVPALTPTEHLLPAIAGVNVAIQPPAYTRRSTREQHAFNIIAEQGALVKWQLQTNSSAHTIALVFNDNLPVAMQGQAGTNWQLSRKIDSTAFYQVSIDGKLSEFYTIEIIKDAAPVIVLQSPKQYTTIDIGEPQQVRITSSITDDYGIVDASIIATIASGNGEAVKFKEQRIGLTGFIPGQTAYHLQQSLLLPSLGMQPGDELYFYVQATDNNRNQSRSDVFIVHLPDTAQLMSLEGLANSLTLKPDYFRSQRQIIIETEQLLKEKDTISEASFKNRSNNLGIDQKLLRLRYSKFLGDENESGESNIDEVASISDFSNADKLKDAFTDKHDNAEDASFFEPGTKKQLQATLAEMWNAEMRLRTFTAQAALPFEYKALRLLKDLQQQSRAYVAKASYKTTPLDPKKRLTGELSKIASPVLQKDIILQPDPNEAVRKALAILEAIRTTGQLPYGIAEILQQANLRLHERAAQQPAVYRSSIESLKQIISNIGQGTPIGYHDITIAEHGLAQMLTAPGRLPGSGVANSAQALSKKYFENLQKLQP